MNIKINIDNIMTIPQEFTPQKYCHSVAIINGLELCQLIESFGVTLFNNNVRLYLGENQAINKKLYKLYIKIQIGSFPIITV